MATLSEVRMMNMREVSGFSGPATLNEMAVRSITTTVPAAEGTLDELEHIAFDALAITKGKWNSRACEQFDRQGFSGTLSEMEYAHAVVLPPAFVGPDIETVLAIEGEPISPTISVADKFDGEIDTYELVGTWPAGVSINNFGVISGTPAGPAYYYNGCAIRATNGVGVAQSNEFAVSISAASPG